MVQSERSPQTARHISCLSFPEHTTHMGGSRRGHAKKAFRSSEYYAHVLMGKRTVKEGEVRRTSSL